MCVRVVVAADAVSHLDDLWEVNCSKVYVYVCVKDNNKKKKEETMVNKTKEFSV